MLVKATVKQIKEGGLKMDAWTECFQKMECKERAEVRRVGEDPWTKKLRSLAGSWNRQTCCLRAGKGSDARTVEGR